MSVVRDGQAPYTSTAAVLEVIEAFRHKNPRIPVTVEVLELLGIAPTIAPRTLQALHLLDLLDADGNPTDALLGLKEASPDDFPHRLGEVITAAYSEIFAHRNPSTDPPEKIVEAFRFYNPASMRPRMIRLFYGLASAAGIVSEVPSIGNAPAGRVAAGRNRRQGTGGENGKGQESRKATRERAADRAQAEALRNRGGGGSTDQTGGGGGGKLSHLHPALVGLLAAIPPADQPWPTRQRYDTFTAAWDATLQVCNPVPDDGEPK